MSLLKLPVFAIMLVLYIVAPLAMLLRYLLSAPTGILISSISLYFYMLHFGHVHPFNFEQLVLWIDAQGTEAKVSILTSVLTIIGFLVAFQSATATWKQASIAEMRSVAAREIEVFYSEALMHLITANIFMENVQEAIRCIEAEGDSPQAQWKAERVLSSVPEFVAVKARLIQMSVDVHSLGGRHGTVLNSVWGVAGQLEKCASAFTEVIANIYVRLPNLSSGGVLSDIDMLKCLDTGEFERFVKIYEKNNAFLSGMSGGIRGALLQVVVGPNFSTIANIVFHPKKYWMALSDILKNPR